MAKSKNSPLTFFLNETHELSVEDRSGGGAIPKYIGISWAAKSKQITASLNSVADKIGASQDPLRDDRFFVMALPVQELEKKSENKKKHPTGTFKEPTEFGGDHSKVFDRLGLDLLQVTGDGRAVVHADREKFDQMLHRAQTLASLGPREQARWATIDSFGIVPLDLRVDTDWLQSLPNDQISDVVIELQPVLVRLEADRVLRAIADLVAQHPGEKLTGTGTDFSGRHWFRGKASRKTIRSIAKDFYSVQSVHGPLFSLAAAQNRPVRTGASRNVTRSIVSVDTAAMPCVAVIDMGVPSDHIRLRQYRRGQFYAQEAPRAPVGGHGSRVASRIVFGDCATADELQSKSGECTYYDAIVADYPFPGDSRTRVKDKLVMEALRGVRGAAPDVRVFNLSIGDVRTLEDFPPVERREKRVLLQDLDNFIFANDCAVIVAAGNSEPGVPPDTDYPEHISDGRWRLGPWASGFNTWVCGSFVSQLSTNGLVQNIGWPSPFSRIGPGCCDAPIPSFGAPGGNWDSSYRFSPGLGVWTYSETGLAEDHSGTSHAAPILAREAAQTLHELQQFCAPGTHPFAVTARAFLTLTATPPASDNNIEGLVRRTLGHGSASKARLRVPSAGSSVILWQGYIESSRDTVRVQLPIPLTWLAEAEQPILRLVVCNDPPVNESAQATWACRKVRAVLHLGPDAHTVRAPRGIHATYPTLERQYTLDRFQPGEKHEAEGDLWLLELSYDEIAPYPPAMDFDPRQRVAFAAELIDLGAAPVDPQPAMQALPIASTMVRLSTLSASVRTPIIIRTS